MMLFFSFFIEEKNPTILIQFTPNQNYNTFLKVEPLYLLTLH